MQELEAGTNIHQYFTFLYSGKKVVARLTWVDESRKAYIHFHSTSGPRCEPFEMDGWPPTQDDIKRADVVLALHRR